MRCTNWKFVAVASLALLAVTLLTVLAVPRDKKNVELRHPVKIVSTGEQWDAWTQNQKCVLFVDCNWNATVVVSRTTYQAFSEWCVENDICPLAISLDANDKTSEARQVCQKLWKDNAIAQGSMKNAGGAGRIVWLQDGTVVDHDWCTAILNWENLQDIESWKNRTEEAFR